MMKTIRLFLLILVVAALLLFMFVRYFNSQPSGSARAYELDKQVSVFFGNANMGSSEDCSKVFPVYRTVLNAETLGPGALHALIKGPGEKEKRDGYFTALNEDVLLKQFEVKDGVAYVDFGSDFNRGVAGSCRVATIRAQIEETLTHLPGIESVVISVNGETEGILEP